ncbi:early boundary activity protein 1-like [Musca vetustissima]|uniref:early boundary activity protein 1-like n=1 Tax=Musca vetustissima TaxID=27455 RepID=UPI002AB7D526|nr:early boundary activity protein 1-like [Musca vetustissima]
MAEVMQHQVNIRKRRILEAFKEETENASPPQPVVAEEKNELVGLDLTTPRDQSPPPQQEEVMPKLISTDKDEAKLIDMKLKVLETWELSKRRAIEKMVKDVEDLQVLEEKIEKLEDMLDDKNIEINEDDFEAFYQKQMETYPMMEPLVPLEELQPQTPKREEQQNKRVKISATSTPITRKPEKIENTEIIDKFVANEDGMVVIGPNGTTIAKSALSAINWSLSGAALTRKILMEVFDRETLAFHTLTGKPSPAFMDCDKPMKNQLDTQKVADIIHLVTQHTNLTAKEVRNAITTKCADENKMYRQREKKRLNAALKLQQQQQQQHQSQDLQQSN